MCDSATHFGHFILSTDKKSFVKSAKSFSGEVLIYIKYMSDFGQMSYTVKCKLLNQYYCYFYGSPLWSLKSTIVQYMCVDWRKALKSQWRVDPRTHCDLITAVSNQIPLILSMKKIFIKCISACLSTSNYIVKIITEFAICNLMSCSGDNYRELLDGQGTLNLEPCLLSWKYNLTNLKNIYLYVERINREKGWY